MQQAREKKKPGLSVVAKRRVKQAKRAVRAADDRRRDLKFEWRS